MQWTRWLLAVVVMGLACQTVAGQPGCAGCDDGGMTTGVWTQSWLGAEPCAGPAGYCLAPGCCEDTHRCCDNAWAGYCEHRAKVEAFWARVGTPKACARPRPCRQAPMGQCSTCETFCDGTMQPMPVAQPLTRSPAMPAASRIPYSPRPVR